MTERLRSGSYANPTKMAIAGTDLGPKKTMLILVIVVGCFAVLWPKVFYPMLVGSAQQHIKPSSIDRTTGCCDVISETDVNTIKIMLELCRTIIKNDENALPLTGREIVAQCRKAVLETCGIDISAVLQEQVRLGQTTKQILSEIRSLNGSLCLKYNFGVSPSKLGVPHRVTLKVSPSSVKQERPPHLRSEMVHPAFRERGRAIPQTQSSSPSRPPPKILEGRPGPVPGMRPTIGGAGHVVSPKQSSTGTMGLIMPVYTIGIVIFFTYTVMKILFKKQPEALYPPVDPDPVFRREVFEANRGHLDPRVSRTPSSKLVVNAMSALLDEVDQELAARRKASAGTEQDVMANGKLHHQEDQASVKVMGMEMTASCEGNKKWSRPDSPVLPTPYTPQPQQKEPPEPPQEIYLEGALPPQSNHLIVADSGTETQNVNLEEDPAVVLAGKMTLSVISLDSSDNGTDESSGRKAENDRSSSNVSDDFEKIDLEDQIGDIIQEAENLTTNRNLLDYIRTNETKDTVDKLHLQTIEPQEQLENTSQDVDEIHKDISNIERGSKELGIEEYQDENIEDILRKYADNEPLDNPTFDDEKLMKDILEENKYQFHFLDPSLRDSSNDNITLTDNISVRDSGTDILHAEITENAQINEVSKIETSNLIDETSVNLQQEIDLSELSQPASAIIIDEFANKETSEQLENIQFEQKNKLDNTIKEVVDEFAPRDITSETFIELDQQKQSAEINLIEEKAENNEKVKEVDLSKEIIDHEGKITTMIEKSSTDVQEISKELTKTSAIKNLDENIITETSIEPAKETASTEQILEEAPGHKTDQSINDLQNAEDNIKTKTEIDKEEKLKAETDYVLEQVESTEEKDIRKIFDDLNAAVLGLSTELNPSRLENVIVDTKVDENIPQSPDMRDENIDINEPEEDDVEYEYEYEEESDSENIDDEIRDIDRVEERLNREQVDGINGDHHGTSSNATLAERDLSDEEQHPLNENNEDEDANEAIQEIIEYISDVEVDEELDANNVNHINNDTESANQ